VTRKIRRKNELIIKAVILSQQIKSYDSANAYTTYRLLAKAPMITK